MAESPETGRILRDARAAAGKSLEEMSQATRIHARYLAEIEAGEAFSLGPVYRRTFVRTYARALGIDPESLPDAPPPAAAPAPAAPEADAARSIAPGPPVEEGAAGRLGRNPFAERSQLRTMAIVVALLLTAFIFSLKWFGSPPGEPAAPEPSAAPETAAAARQEPLRAFSAGGTQAGAAAADSLVLGAAATESVWVHIVIDNDSTVEYTLPPRYAISLRAKDNFLLSVGNPAGLSVSLNGRKIALPGAEGNRPVKNVFLSRKSLPE